MALQHLLRQQRDRQQPVHQRPYRTGICPLRTAVPLPYHRGDERKQSPQHHLPQLLEKRGEQLRRAALLRQAIPTAVVSDWAEHLCLLPQAGATHLRTRPHQLSPHQRRDLRHAQGLDCQRILPRLFRHLRQPGNRNPDH